MLVSPNNLEMINKELRNTRLQEAEHWRLIQEVKEERTSIFTWIRSLVPGLWQDIRSIFGRNRGYIPISQKPKKSPSL
jgi:hypothetical protein